MKTKTNNQTVRSFKYYDVVLAVSASIPLLSNLAATKPIQFGPLILDAGFLLFPLAYIFDDILTEVYGFRYARRAIWVSAAVLLLGVVYLTFAVGLPVAPGYSDQASYAKVFGFFPPLVGASVLAFLIGSFANARIVSRNKIKAQGKHMWRRLLWSTVVGEFLDTLVFSIIYTLLFGLSVKDFFIYLATGYLWKVFVEAVLMRPVTYPVINWIKKREGIDVFDHGVNRTPFRLSVQR